jgi:hypothetical protein
MDTLLWIDDLRDPLEGDWLVFSPIPHPYKVHWVKSYGEFIGWIEENGLPTGIAFDHDLADNFSLREDSEIGDWYDLDNNKEYTGYDCAKYVVDYCLDNDVPLPKFNSHSANSVGKENILKLLTNFLKHN